MRRPVIIILGTALAACSANPSGTIETASRPETVRSAGMGSLTMVNVTEASNTPLNQPAAEVYAVLPAVYDSLSVPRTMMDPKGFIVSSQGFRIRQRMGRTALSRYIECGATQIGPNADSYEVYMTVSSRVVASGSTSALQTTVEAAARPLSFAQEYSRCSSKGVLEQRIAEGVRSRLPK